MNICFLSRDYPPRIIGGVGTYTYEMAQELIKLGHCVYVISEAIEEEGEFIEDGIFVTRIRRTELAFLNFLQERFSRTIDYLEYSYAVSRALRRLVRKYKIDIVESCEARSEGFWYYLLHRNPPLVIKLHTPEGIVFNLDKIPGTFDNRVKDILEEWWIFRANKIVPITRAIADLVSRYYRVRLPMAEAVYYPVDAQLFCPGDGVHRSDGSANVLYAGRLEVRKGVEFLVEAVPLVLGKFPNTHFYFVGQDAGVRYLLDKRINEIGCAASITFIDKVVRKEMIDYYRKADVCVFPSLWENFAFVALEAMACGKTVIASRVGGFCEMIEDGKSGIFCNPADAKDLAEKIILALTDSSLTKEIGQKARERIIASYSPLERAKEMVKIYSKII